MREAPMPERYWHAEVKYGQSGRTPDNVAYCFNRTREQIVAQLIKPILDARDAVVGGMVVPSNTYYGCRIYQTDQSSVELALPYVSILTYEAIRAASRDGHMLALWEGTDRTEEIFDSVRATMSGLPAAGASSGDVDTIRRICHRIRPAASMLAERRAGSAIYEVSDEYDAQDLLQAIIRAYTPHSIAEEPISKLCGITGSRADIALEALGIIVEVKYAREGDLKALFRQMRDDLTLYGAWKPLKHLVFVIYNSHVLKDPERLQTLPPSFGVGAVLFDVEVVLA